MNKIILSGGITRDAELTFIAKYIDISNMI